MEGEGLEISSLSLSKSGPYLSGSIIIHINTQRLPFWCDYFCTKLYYRERNHWLLQNNIYIVYLSNRDINNKKRIKRDIRCWVSKFSSDPTSFINKYGRLKWSQYERANKQVYQKKSGYVRLSIREFAVSPTTTFDVDNFFLTQQWEG